MPLAAGGILSLLVQRKNQRNTPQAARPALRAGSASGPGISVRHIHAPYGNAVIHDGALRVVPSPLAVPHGDPKASKSKAAASDVSGVALGPPEVRQSRRVKPAGRRTGMCAVFGRGRMPRTKIPAGTANPPHSGGRTAGVCFFCLLFFAQAKKSRASAVSGAIFKKWEVPPGRPSRAEPIADVATTNSRRRHGLRCPSPQPLSRWERGFSRYARTRMNSYL